MNPNDLHIFAALTTALITPLLQVLRDNVGGVVDNVRPLGLVLLGLWLAVVGADVAGGHKHIRQVRREMIIAAVCLGTLVSGAVYMAWVGELFATILPNALGSLLGVPGNPSDSIDKVLISEIKAAVLVYDKLPWGFSTLPLAFCVIAYLLFACGMAAATYLVFTLANVTNLLCVYIGPLALVLAAIPWTRKLAAGWLAVLTSGVAIQFLALAVLVFTAKGQLDAIQKLVAVVSTSNANSMEMVFLLARCGITVFIGYLLIKSAVPIAHAMVGGVYQQSQGLINAAFGPAAGAVNAVTTAAGNAAGAVGANAARQMGAGAVNAAAASARGSGFRASAATGRSLSGATP